MRATVPQRDAEAGFSLIELLVVIGMSAVVMGAIVSVVISTMQTQRFSSAIREVMDDGRVSLNAMRIDIREARRVLYDSNAAAGQMHLWIDQNQDNVMQTTELVCYAPQLLSPGRYSIVRWTGSAGPCTNPPATARTVARTLRNVAPFTFTPVPINDPDPLKQTRIVTIELQLDVQSGAGPKQVALRSTVRLRNVT